MIDDHAVPTENIIRALISCIYSFWFNGQSYHFLRRNVEDLGSRPAQTAMMLADLLLKNALWLICAGHFLESACQLSLSAAPKFEEQTAVLQ